MSYYRDDFAPSTLYTDLESVYEEDHRRAREQASLAARSSRPRQLPSSQATDAEMYLTAAEMQWRRDHVGPAMRSLTAATRSEFQEQLDDRSDQALERRRRRTRGALYSSLGGNPYRSSTSYASGTGMSSSLQRPRTGGLGSLDYDAPRLDTLPALEPPSGYGGSTAMGTNLGSDRYGARFSHLDAGNEYDEIEEGGEYDQYEEGEGYGEYGEYDEDDPTEFHDEPMTPSDFSSFAPTPAEAYANTRVRYNMRYTYPNGQPSTDWEGSHAQFSTDMGFSNGQRWREEQRISLGPIRERLEREWDEFDG